ncbi:MAG: DUF465 domain-containing protein [Pseudomonadota bacterium]
MSVDAHVTELRRKHAEISEQVERLEHTPSANSLDVTKLKREKLRIKDAIEQLDS